MESPAPPPTFGPLAGRDQALVYALAAVLLAAAAARYAGLGGGRPRTLRRLDSRTPMEYQIDLNRAGAPELDLLPGIGPVKAEAIVRYRQAHGSFQRLDDLAKVPGLTRDRIAKIRALVVLSPPTPAGDAPR